VTRRLALITGVGRAGQVGEAVARVFAERGDQVLLVNRDLADVTARADELRSSGLAATPYACDLADAKQVAALARQVSEEHGPSLDALVNLAGGFAISGPVAESDPEVWTRMNRINVVTAYTTTRAFLPHLRAARGAVVFFASDAALPGASVANVWAYAAAKSAVLTLMRAVAREERDAGVRANAVAPTSIRTAANVESMGEDVRYVEREDVAAAVWTLCAADTRAITGQVVRLA
jgi:NAD(P)-dependent dehydrogenase (short-subunit alcohol dehydrogenase family)